MSNKKAVISGDVCMTFSEDEVESWSETQLLIAVKLYYELKMPLQSARKTFPGVMDISAPSLDNYLEGRGTPSVDKWVLLYKHTQFEIIPRWLKLQVKKMEHGK